MATDEAWEIEVDSEATRVRKFLERQYVKAGVDEFIAFRLSMVPELDWHRVVDQKSKGVSDETLLELYLD